MNFAYLSNNYAAYKWFYDLVDNHNFTPISVLFDNNKKIKLKNEIAIYMNSKIDFCNELNLIDYDFVLQYYFLRFKKNDVMIKFLPYVQLLFVNLINKINEGDIVISSNSGTWGSRTLHEICRIKKAKFFYHETFFFKDTHHISYKPFMYSSKYGKPELVDVFLKSKFNQDDIYFLNNYLEKNHSKYEQENGFLNDSYYDYFIVGQMPYDTNVVIPVKIYKTSEELCYFKAINNPGKNFVYKVHPKLQNLSQLKYYKSIKTLANVTITNASIFDIFKCVDRILTISSTVGIEAQLRGLNVEWCSNTDYADFKLEIDENKYRFINACKKYMFLLNKLYDILMERSGNNGENKKIPI